MADNWITRMSDSELLKLINRLRDMPGVHRPRDYTDTVHAALPEAYRRGLRVEW